MFRHYDVIFDKIESLYGLLATVAVYVEINWKYKPLFWYLTSHANYGNRTCNFISIWLIWNYDPDEWCSCVDVMILSKKSHPNSTNMSEYNIKHQHQHQHQHLSKSNLQFKWCCWNSEITFANIKHNACEEWQNDFKTA